jgi:hypothetical protein
VDLGAYVETFLAAWFRAPGPAIRAVDSSAATASDGVEKSPG